MALGLKRSISFLVVDVIGLFLSLFVAFYYRFGHVQIEGKGYLATFLIIIVVNYFFGLYSPQNLLRTFAPLFYKIVSSVLAFLFVAILAFLIFERRDLFGRGFLLLFFTIYSVLGIFIYSLLIPLNRLFQQGRKIIILSPQKYNLKSLIDNLKKKNTFSEIIEYSVNPEELQFVENFKEQLGKVSYRFLTIVIADECFNPTMFDLLLRKKIEGVRVYQLTSFCEKFLQKLPVNILEPSRLIYSGRFRLSHDVFSLRIKRLTDLVFSLVLFALTWPLILLSALLVKLTSRGPALYSQTRVGQYGSHFTIYKLRTMVANAEKDGAQWAQSGDSRITVFGKFLRISRIDELPQLWNIVKGDMSFIGPRPERPEFVDNLEAEIPYYNLRHFVKPGISGWAQVMYPYGASVEDAKEKLSYDLFYVKNFSFTLDIYIALKTLQVVMKLLGR